jgi:hypothetical protein
MERMGFDSALETLTKLDGFLNSLGLPVKKDRWHEAGLMVRRAKEQREHIESGGQLRPIENYVPGLFEALEIHKIIRAFSTDRSQALKDKVSRALCGPISPLDEQPKNSEARNAMFELSLAADWKNGGADVKLSEPDIQIGFGNTRFLVECKRPFYAHSVRANIKNATQQLETTLAAPGHEDSFGVIAVSLNRVFSPGNRVCCAPVEEGRTIITNTLLELVERNKSAWKFNRFRGRIVAVTLHLAAPWEVDKRALVYLSTCKFFPTGRFEDAFRVFYDNVTKLYPS